MFEVLLVPEVLYSVHGAKRLVVLLTTEWLPRLHGFNMLVFRGYLYKTTREVVSLLFPPLFCFLIPGGNNKEARPFPFLSLSVCEPHTEIDRRLVSQARLSRPRD